METPLYKSCNSWLSLGFELPPTGGAIGIVKNINFVVGSAAPPIGSNSKPKGKLLIALYTRDYNLGIVNLLSNCIFNDISIFLRVCFVY